MNYKKITSVILSALIISAAFSYHSVKAADTNAVQNTTNSAQDAPIDGTPYITNISSNSVFNSTIDPIIKINNPLLTEADVGQGKSIYATLNGQPYKLSFISKDGNVLTLKGDTIGDNTPNGQKSTLTVYSTANTIATGNQAQKSSSVDFIIDTNPPSISFEDKNGRTIDDSGIYSGEVDPVIKLGDNYHIASYDIKLNGNPYDGTPTQNADGSITFLGKPLSEDGNYSISVKVVDDAGNSTTFSRSFTIDNTAPKISISGITNNSCVNTNVIPKISINDADLDASKTTVNVTRNDSVLPVQLSQNEDGSFSFEVTNEGTYSFTVTAYDKVGNTTTSEPISFSIDKTAPSLNFNFTNGQYFNTPFKPTAKTTNADDFISKLLINGSAYSFDDLPAFSDGTYEVEAQAKDKAGNLSEISYLKFIVDTIAPQINISNVSDNYYYNSSVSPIASSTDVNLSSFKMFLNGAEYNAQPITQDGSYQLLIESSDKANNMSRKILNFFIDKTAPSISIKGLANNGFFNYFLNPYVYINDPNELMSILLLDGQDYHGGFINQDGKHILLVEAVDKAGNITKEAYNFFIKATPPEIYVSEIENGKTYDHSVIPRISFSKDVVDSYTKITLDGNPYNIGDEISSSGKHELVISVKDQYGNKAEKKIEFTIEGNISSSATVSSKIHTIIHKILPAKTKKNNRIVYIISAIIWVIIMITIGIIIYRYKKSKRSDSNE
ncbi:hypothetical protein BJV85_003615 [Clostridium acetobutylicum]|uniref:Secreted protein contains fibronectin type III domains n=1 Tax=Clostridium acetobutylicum (strain ATCC 824 / DSM 792 / JCM 1419 / IAM 19013 / LMG 5710 / NBRC 13948 / NRRL B-527 / VKM B-1787 / 2291 / W) TaxID=272562 RepID=Q97LZ7_CLOAB|nr:MULTISPECIES: Ig-like domain-containing protein [Clostridium]AAK78383.1 Secreted protein contains fibronectin type III domains [Clostridium acetobutylicum ATCC 824]ADZ19452.1 Secreted protein contains fibronectin type III domains [Clostridium acetobutylicum EA 2018]AEI31221.1 fibronectin type III domain-containing protein [Clostridium acetobutylicum DSM 1731]AWV80106.1 hypothetical protein DK921_08370 [Clostridium acetobutylicum]KHD37822.1 fibronectin [Clostridium acetobutylicum]